MLLALALVPGAPILEPSLREACGGQVLEHARIESNHGDSNLLIYDDRLAPRQVNCLLDWASSWHGRIINGVRTYRSKRYPLGPYDIPPEMRARR